MVYIRRCIPCFAVVIIILSALPCYATTLSFKDETALVKESELIFLGTVTDIQYRLSEKNAAGENPIPFTFVTFKIEKILKGKIGSGSSITLRIAGGYAGNKKYLSIAGIPLFDKGERSILFVAGNGKKLCPIVGWAQGRFRVIDKNLYSDYGEEVLLTDSGTLGFGQIQPLREVIENTIGDRLFVRTESLPPPKNNTEIKGKKLNPDSFMDFVSKLIVKNITEKELKNPEPVKNADINEKIYFSTPAPALPGEGNK